MGHAAEDRKEAAKYPAGDILNILFTHHARIHETLERIESSRGTERKQAFAELKTFLKAHETAEEAVVRPMSMKTAGEEVVEARNEEEAEADEDILALSKLDFDSADFDEQFAEFKQAVSNHAESEEEDEFPALESELSVEERKDLGRHFLQEFAAAGGPA